MGRNSQLPHCLKMSYGHLDGMLKVVGRSTQKKDPNCKPGDPAKGHPFCLIRLKMTLFTGSVLMF